MNELNAALPVLLLFEKGASLATQSPHEGDGYSQFYGLDTTLDEIESPLRRAKKRVYDFPLLQPLTIADAKYVVDADIMAMKIGLPDGRQVLTESTYRDEELNGGDNSFLGRVIGPLLLIAIPPHAHPARSAKHSRTQDFPWDDTRCIGLRDGVAD